MKSQSKISPILILAIVIIGQTRAQGVFKDLIVTNRFVYGLTENGRIRVFNKTNGDFVKKEIGNTSEILQMAIDNLGNIIIADKDNTVKKYNEQKDSWDIISKYSGSIFGIVFSSKNQCYLITDKGIEDIGTHKLYFSKESLNHQINYKDKWGKPYCYYIDRNDRIWLGFGYGEWGGNLFIFETKDHTFLIPTLGNFDIALWPIKSFFEDSLSVYLSTGLQHMMNSGAIVRFDDLKTSIVLESKSHWSKPSGKDSTKTMISAEYIGPGAYNIANKSFYFYSQHGIFKGDRLKDLTKIENWEIILKPKLHWNGGQPDAVGSPMNVLKLAIIDAERFVFLSQNDGIGFFNGKELIMIR